MQSKWSELSTFHKVVTVLSYIGEFATAILLILQFSGVFSETNPWYMLPISAVSVCEAILMWNSRRKASYVLIAVSVLAAACYIVGMII